MGVSLIAGIFVFLIASRFWHSENKLVGYLKDNKPRIHDSLKPKVGFKFLNRWFGHRDLAEVNDHFLMAYLFVKHPDDDEKTMQYKKPAKNNLILLMVVFFFFAFYLKGISDYAIAFASGLLVFIGILYVFIDVYKKKIK